MRIRSPFLNRLLTRIAVWIVKAIFATCRTRTVVPPGTSLYDDPDELLLYSMWHDAILCGSLGRHPPRNTAGLVSRHRDGGYIADMLTMIGVRPVRGSTSRGGARAMKELIDATSEYHVCITPDGPRGPRREMKAGIVYLASATGRRILPAGYAASSAWRIGSKNGWTDMLVPKPFSTLYIVGAELVSVPPDLDRNGIDVEIARVQAGMDRANETAEALARGELKPDEVTWEVETVELRRAA